jgi:hypothetical protein
MMEHSVSFGDLLTILSVRHQDFYFENDRELRKIDLTVWHENRVRESMDVYRTKSGEWVFTEDYARGEEEYRKMRVVNVSVYEDFDFENNQEKTFKVWEVDVVTK